MEPMRPSRSTREYPPHDGILSLSRPHMFVRGKTDNAYTRADGARFEATVATHEEYTKEDFMDDRDRIRLTQLTDKGG